jgi:hypothetical protein
MKLQDLKQITALFSQQAARPETKKGECAFGAFPF